MFRLLKKFSSLQVTCVLLTAFLLLIFWGVLGQAAAGNQGEAFATQRFFGSYILWVLGFIPLPAFKGLGVVAIFHLLCSMAFRMPKVFVSGGWRNLGLWGMHVALLFLIAGSLIGSEFRQEYNGFRAVPAPDIAAATAGRSMEQNAAESAFVSLGDSVAEPAAMSAPEPALEIAADSVAEPAGGSLDKNAAVHSLDSIADSSVKNIADTSSESPRLDLQEIIFFSVSDSQNVSRIPVTEGYPYYVFHKGQVDMFGVQVELYSATYDPFKFVPYVFMFLFLLSGAFHYGVKVRQSVSKNHGGQHLAAEKEPDAVKSSVQSLLLLAVMSGICVLPASIFAAEPVSDPAKEVAVGSAAEPGDVPAAALAGNAAAESVARVFPERSLDPATPVLVGDAVRPFDSFARGVLYDFCGRVKYKHENPDGSKRTLSATEVVSSIRQNPEIAEQFKLFKVLRSDVTQALALPSERYVSYRDLLASRGILELYASRKDEHPATAEMNRLLSNIHLYELIAQGVLPGAFPDLKSPLSSPESPRAYPELPQSPQASQSYPDSPRAYPESKLSPQAVLQFYPGLLQRLKIEVFYNRANFALLAFIFALLGSITAAVNSIFKKPILDVLSNGACALTSVILITTFILRFYIASRPPLSSLYEIVLLVALLLESFEVGAFLFCKKRTFSLMVPVTILGAVLLFFAKFILEPGDLFQPIPAVLNSSVFLTVHVFTIALGFAGMILSGIVSHVALYREGQSPDSDKTENIRKLLYATLGFGAMFTIVGTLLGGVWADFAWGRFWGFDPKECGALFVILWAMLSLHLGAGRLVSRRGFALLNCFNVIVTFLCWFGINLLGVGLHSYGFQNGSFLWLALFILVDSIVIICLGSSKKKKSAHRVF